MIIEIELTYDQKVEMYQLVEKDKLIRMLIESNNLIEKLMLQLNSKMAVQQTSINVCSHSNLKCENCEIYL